MHDIDRLDLRLVPEMENNNYEQYEYNEAEWGGGVLNETETMHHAAELLESSNEAELELNFKDLLESAAKKLGGSISAPVLKRLVQILKQASNHTFPELGSPVGGLGFKTAESQNGQAFGLELEGLSLEDKEFETAKSFVQFAAEAGKNAAFADQAAHPAQIAQQAAQAAARSFAPGLLARNALTPQAGEKNQNAPACCNTGAHATGGQWRRHGNKIILLGV